MTDSEPERIARAQAGTYKPQTTLKIVTRGNSTVYGWVAECETCIGYGNTEAQAVAAWFEALAENVR